MPPAPTPSGADVCRALGKIGFVVTSQKGSHRKLKHDDGRVVIVPMHGELRKGTVRSICRQAKIGVEELTELLG